MSSIHFLPPVPRFDDLFPRFTTDDLEGLILGVLLIFVALALLFFARPKRRIVVRLKGVTWRRNQFCRGWLITGDTGSGKTTSGINQLAHQVFKNEPTWGGLCIDEKGVYWEDEDKLLGALPDEEVARRVRRHWDSVRQRSCRLGIPNRTPKISSPHA